MMRRATRMLFGLTVCVLSTVVAAEDIVPATPAGTWAWTYDYGDGPVDSLLTLKVKEKKVTGVYHGEKGEMEVMNGVADGAKVAFDLKVPREGQEITVRFAGEAKEDALTGTLTAVVEGEDHEFPWKAKRATRAADVAGTWQLEVAADSGNTYTPKVKIAVDESKLSGRYITTEFGEHDLSSVALKNNVLTFHVEIQRDGHTLKIDYEVKPRGDQLAGKVKYDLDGGTGAGTVAGKLTPEKK